ncbi:protein RRNAD1 isoform X3 [Megalobrama amblycephala]|uniref:protein RRNAD1 isoform X3 n=1 Tax=Megalobrama amblycephala TaxID=75352 RepID=UPI00201402D5|nr:protein RRNAD1 isoform X3 [Megalobrama amblycephala]
MMDAVSSSRGGEERERMTERGGIKAQQRSPINPLFNQQEQEQRELAEKLTWLLSTYRRISDSYIIEFFSESLWDTLPVSWQEALGDLTPPQIADLLLDKEINDRRYPSVWPLSLLALRTAAHVLSFPRKAPGGHSEDAGAAVPEEFQSNQSQSSLLRHIFRKHVKPKKQHEIRRLGTGHLTRFLSFGLGLDVTGIEADPNLVSMANKFDRQLLLTLTKENQRSGKAEGLHSAPGPSPRHVVGWVNPQASWDVFIQQLVTASESDSSVGPTTGPYEKKQRVEDLHLEPHSCQTKGEDKAELQNTLQTQRTDINISDSVAQINTGAFPSGMETESVAQINTGAFPSGMETEMLTCKSIPVTDCGVKELGSFVLTGLHACGDLSSTLLRHFTNCPQVQVITSVACCYMKISTQENPNPPGVFQSQFSSDITVANSSSEYGYPMSDWVRGLPGHQLSYKAREGACHAIEDYLLRLREESGLLRTHCYRAILESIIRAERPHMRRPGVQTVKKAHALSFSEYACLALPRVGLPADLPYDPVCVDSMLAHQGKVVAYFSLVLLLAPLVETLVLLDRMIFLQERGFQSELIPLFDAAFSPRNLVLVAVKPKEAQS